jgi:hypothetical protein
MLGILNSSVATQLLEIINPTVNCQVGDLGELPVPPGVACEQLQPLVLAAIELQRRLDAFDETSTDFIRPAVTREELECPALELTRLQRKIDAAVSDVYGLHGSDANAPNILDDIDLARLHMSYAIGRTLGRWGGEPGTDAIVQIAPADSRLLERVKGELAAVGGPAHVDKVEHAVNGIRRFIEREFYDWHVALYARRPIYWLFGNRDRKLLLRHEHADASTLASLLRQIGGTLPAGYSRSADDGIAANLAPLGEWIASSTLRNALAGFSRGSTAGSGCARRSTPSSPASGVCPRG